MIPSYGKLYNVGKREVANIFDGPVVIQEKVDGSQFSFMRMDDYEDGTRRVLFRSKGRMLEGQVGQFLPAQEAVLANAHLLRPGWIYRGEYLQKPKHNVLAYDRVPRNHVILFDVIDHEGQVRVLDQFVPREYKGDVRDKFAFEAVPTLYVGRISRVEELDELLNTKSILGGQLVEGVVIKNYAMRQEDGSPVMAKYVSKRFREVAGSRHKAVTGLNPIEALANKYKSEARFHKAVQHLRDDGKLTGSMKDIGPLLGELARDLHEEEGETIREEAFKIVWKQVVRKAQEGLATWYEQQLATEEG